jgi:hypothetical protein
MFFRRVKPAPRSFEQELEEARRRGFAVEAAPAGYRLSKNGCAAVIDRELRFVERPGILAGGEIMRLLDRGYQKFLATRDGKTRPALATQLRLLHDFDAELRHIFRLTSLYNESLGTVSDRYHYDRLAGRPQQ